MRVKPWGAPGIKSLKEERMMARRHGIRCPRCNGAMVYERFQDMLDLFFAWRCLNCGEIVDPVVARNREPEKKLKLKKRAAN